MTLPVPPGQWAHRYAACQDCGTVEQPHYGRGFCEDCYRRWHWRQRMARIRSTETPAQARARRAARAEYMRRRRLLQKAAKREERIAKQLNK